jgi:hypothetical protein
MEPVFLDHGSDRRQFGDLMPERFGIITGLGDRRTSDMRAVYTGRPGELAREGPGGGRIGDVRAARPASCPREEPEVVA